jgi:drug/metabolite transporter (DMT)-like permease
MFIGLAMTPFVPVPAADAWPYLIASAVIHLAYYLLLMKSFRLGDFGQAYPIARGTAPLVVTLLAAVFAHEVPDGWAAAGIALSCAGLTGVALWGLRARRPPWAAIGAALATGLTIAAYTVVDGLGVRASGSSLGYIAWLMAVEGVTIPAYALYRWRGELVAVLRPFAGAEPSARPCPCRPTAWSCGRRPARSSPRSRRCASRQSSPVHAVISSMVVAEPGGVLGRPPV